MLPDAPNPAIGDLSRSLSPLERTVVALGLRDPLWSVPAAPRRWPGKPHPDQQRLHLANPRLETLRRFIVLLRHARPTGDSAVTDLLAAGFSPGQIHEAEMMIGFDHRI